MIGFDPTTEHKHLTEATDLNHSAILLPIKSWLTPLSHRIAVAISLDHRRTMWSSWGTGLVIGFDPMTKHEHLTEATDLNHSAILSLKKYRLTPLPHIAAVAN